MQKEQSGEPGAAEMRKKQSGEPGAAEMQKEPIPASAVGADGTSYALGMFQSTESILVVKQKLATLSDMSVGRQSIYLVDDTRESGDLELKNHELLHNVQSYSSSVAKLHFAVMQGLKQTEAVDFVKALPPNPQPQTVIKGDTMKYPSGIAVIPGHPELFVVVSFNSHTVQIVKCGMGLQTEEHQDETRKDEDEDEDEDEYEDEDEDGDFRGRNRGGRAEGVQEMRAAREREPPPFVATERTVLAVIGCEGEQGVGKTGIGAGEFASPWSVVVTGDNKHLIVSEDQNHRLQVLRFVVAADSSSAELEFVRFIGAGSATAEAGSLPGWLHSPNGLALRMVGQHETVLVADRRNNRVSEFELDGTFVRTIGVGHSLNIPRGVAACPTGDVAVVDYSSVFVFNGESGELVCKFGRSGKDQPGEFGSISAITCDLHGNFLVLDAFTSRLQVTMVTIAYGGCQYPLCQYHASVLQCHHLNDTTTRYCNACLQTHSLQYELISPLAWQVFTNEGVHVCTRNDLGLKTHSYKGIVWDSDEGRLAITDGTGNNVLVWVAAS
jgi:DNA-binding beta-propeller fold protein YncE